MNGNGSCNCLMEFFFFFCVAFCFLQIALNSCQNKQERKISDKQANGANKGALVSTFVGHFFTEMRFRLKQTERTLIVICLGRVEHT